MNISGTPYRTIWQKNNLTTPYTPPIVQVIDQRQLPFRFHIVDLHSVQDMARVIRDMTIRGAGLIGASAGYGMMLATHHAPRDSWEAFWAQVQRDGDSLKATRPTAVNLAWAVERQLTAIQASYTPTASLEKNISDAILTAEKTAQAIADEDADYCRRIGQHGLEIIQAIAERKNGQPINILTHCNAGWLAFVDYGSATAPIYAAHDAGIAVHVWVDETRPRNQGARLTAWELAQHGVPHHVIADNVGGHLMQHGMVDLCIVGSDRTTHTGDVANKIGTYLKALAAHDNGVPFYVALPSSTFDWVMTDGIRQIPIEERGGDEVHTIEGETENGDVINVRILPKSSPVMNVGFDVTPARLVTGLITERGICKPNSADIYRLFPEHHK
jgi:methylthioribose-1-phosphate isomerase